MSKKTTTVLIVIVLLAMILTGTFAWLQYNQHKTNEANGPGLKYDASLIENFKEIENWKVSAAAVTKQIRVKNSGLVDGSYGDVYVRLQLKEYMEMYPIEYTYSDYRYMIGTDGEFITFDSEAAALTAYPGHIADFTKDLEATEERWYVQTQERDDNGQYGKFLTLSASSGEAVPLIPPIDGGVERATDTENHDLATNGECAYPIHLWQASPGEAEDCELDFHDYILWYLGDDVISIGEWLDPDGPYEGLPVKKWIYDTESAEGWVYWGAALTPDETTSNLLEAIKLIKQPDGNFYYAIHVDMEAVSFSELSSTGAWSDVHEDILTALAVPTVKSVAIDAAGITELADGTLVMEASRKTTQEFSFEVTSFNGASKAVDWTIKANTTIGTFSMFTESPTSTKDGSTISQSGVLKIAPGETAPSLTIRATSVHDMNKYDEVTITLNGPLVTDIEVNGPDTAVVGSETAEAYIATVNGSDDPSSEVRWEVEESSKSSANTYMDESGILHVGADETKATLIVKAISTYDETKVGTKEVTVSGVITLMRMDTYAFAATAIAADGTEQPLIWDVDSANSATTFMGNLLTIAEDEIEETLTVTARTYGGTIVGTLTVKVGQIGRVSINETNVTLYRSGKGTSEQEFTLTVNAIYEADEEIIWTLAGNSSGDTGIVKTGETTAELTVGSDETSQSLMVTAASTYDPYRSSSVIVKVVQSTGVTITTTPATLYRNATFGAVTQTFVAVVGTENGTDPGVTWSLSGSSGASSIGLTSGLLTVGITETSQSLTVTATSVYDGTKTTSVVVPVVQATGVTISTTPNTLHRNTTAGGSTSQTFAASVSATSVGSLTGITWSLSGSSGASSINPTSGLLTVGSTETSQSLTVTATSVYDGTKTTSVVVPVVQATGVSITTTPNTLHRNTTAGGSTTQSFAASVSATSGGSLTGITWTLSGSSGASNIDLTSGALSVGSTETSQSLTVTATSSYDGTRTASVIVPVVQATGVSITTTPATLYRSGQGTSTQTFAASVSATSGGSLTGITWSLSGSSGASSINSTSGALSVGSTETAMMLMVTATSVYDGSKSASKAVNVGQVLSITVANQTTTRAIGSTGSVTFAAVVTPINSASQTVTWGVSGNSSTSTTITSGGVLTIAADETGKTLMVTATSSYDGSKVGRGMVTVSLTKPSNLLGTTADVGKTFSTGGYTWRVLFVDGSGNMLVTTTHTLSSGVTQFNPDGGGNAYESSTLKDVIGDFYSSSAMDELRPYVQRVNIKTEAMTDWSTVYNSANTGYFGTAVASGMSVVDGTGTKSAFALSFSEIITYFSKTDVNDMKAYNYGTSTSGSYWTRTPYSSSANAGYVYPSGTLSDFTVSTTFIGARPALWINLSS